MESIQWRGMAMALIGPILWGVSGTVAQKLFQYDGFSPGWLVTVRMIISGIILLWFGWSKGVWEIWKDSKDRIQLIIFGIIGMLGVQYTYFATIQVGNASVATLLQFLGPALITVYFSLRFKRLPSAVELLALCLAFLGTFLLVTNGSVHKLSVPGNAVAWGLTSAFTAAFYIVYPGALLKRYSSTIIIGWGMLIGGLGMAIISPPWQVAGQHWTILSSTFVGFVIIFGTLLPFYLFLDSMRYIGSTYASVLSSAEPLSAAVVSVVWLGIPMGFFEVIGGLCIIGTVVSLSVNSSKKGTTTLQE
jgi:drug/metabolite transporter (DMT)-like permease